MGSSSRVLLGSQSEEFGWFPCPLTSSTLIQVDTKEVGYTHTILPTLEYSTPTGSPTVSGLTSPRALRSRVLQASSASEDVRRVLQKFLDFCLGNERFGYLWSRLSILGVHRVL